MERKATSNALYSSTRVISTGIRKTLGDWFVRENGKEGCNCERGSKEGSRSEVDAQQRADGIGNDKYGMSRPQATDQRRPNCNPCLRAVRRVLIDKCSRKGGWVARVGVTELGINEGEG